MDLMKTIKGGVQVGAYVGVIGILAQMALKAVNATVVFSTADLTLQAKGATLPASSAGIATSLSNFVGGRLQFPDMIMILIGAMVMVTVGKVIYDLLGNSNPFRGSPFSKLASIIVYGMIAGGFYLGSVVLGLSAVPAVVGFAIYGFVVSYILIMLTKLTPLKLPADW